jgi:hypothetical protein
MAAVSNCDSPSEYYSICCIHECANILNAFEAKVGAQSAKPETILNLTVSMLSEEVPQQLPPSIVEALYNITSNGDGEVALHSRLFAQWLHYVFPHECPYPHLRGTFNPLTPSEWLQKHGTSSEASAQEMAEQMKFQSNQTKLQSNQTETLHDVFMSQWTMEDDLRDSDSAFSADSDSNVMSPYLLMLRIAIFAAPAAVVILKMVTPMLCKLYQACRIAHVVKGEDYIPK